MINSALYEPRAKTRGVELHLVGAIAGKHTFFVRVEELSDGWAMINRPGAREDRQMPWLRPACSCGWRSRKQRFTIEENAHWYWAKHVERASRHE